MDGLTDTQAKVKPVDVNTSAFSALIPEKKKLFLLWYECRKHSKKYF